MVWKIDQAYRPEAQKIKYLIVPYTRGTGLDLGCGAIPTYKHFLGVDNCKEWGSQTNGIKADCEDLRMFADESMDFVFSSHLLEHIEDYRSALGEWWRVVKPGGHLVIYLPHKDHYPNIGVEGSNPDHKHDFYPNDIQDAMKDSTIPESVEGGWDLLLDETRADDDEYSFVQVYRKRDDDETYDLSLHSPKDPTALVCRFGGFGDMLQTSSVLAALKKQGYHVTLMTTPKGQDIVRHDPSIDAWHIQDTDQVPNNELDSYWKFWAKRCDKFVNLSESVEMNGLSHPTRSNYYWKDSARRMYFGKHNYLQLMHAMAEVPYAPRTKFYPSIEERERAEAYVNAIGAPVVLWALAGSSVHKAYPYTDNVVAKLMLETKAHVVFVGDDSCKILEYGWEKEPRVHCKSGELAIRETLALAQACAVVVGPETGILNGVAYERNGKVLMLSHSSKRNLSEDWINTSSLEPSKCPCYPCHKLHYCKETCNIDEESGASFCAARIAPERVYDAIVKHIKRGRK